MPTPTLRLMAACNLAYQIQADGRIQPDPSDPSTNDLLAIAQLGQVQAFASGHDLIDAALVASGDLGVVVAFRGTLPPSAGRSAEQIIRDWLQDAEMALETGDKLPGRVHHGFLGALDALWGEVADAVDAQLTQSPVKRLYVTGHSKGGSMAHLAAARFALSSVISGRSIAVRSFEGAHPGNGDFADTYARLVPDALRYEFQDDVVPHLPLSWVGRGLLGKLELFDGLARLDDDHDYAGAGRLQFVDWGNQVVEDTPWLRAQRFEHLTGRLARGEFNALVAAHAVGMSGGLWDALQQAGA